MPLGSAGVCEILGDGTPGRVLRSIIIDIRDGTNPNTLIIQTISRWNGNTILPTDNVAKNATTGHFTLDVNGHLLTVEASGLSGNVLFSYGVLSYNGSGTLLICPVYPFTNDIQLRARNAATSTDLDWTALVDAGNGIINLEIMYITDA